MTDGLDEQENLLQDGLEVPVNEPRLWMLMVSIFRSEWTDHKRTQPPSIMSRAQSLGALEMCWLCQRSTKFLLHMVLLCPNIGCCYGSTAGVDYSSNEVDVSQGWCWRLLELSIEASIATALHYQHGTGELAYYVMWILGETYRQGYMLHHVEPWEDQGTSADKA